MRVCLLVTVSTFPVPEAGGLEEEDELMELLEQEAASHGLDGERGIRKSHDLRTVPLSGACVGVFVPKVGNKGDVLFLFKGTEMVDKKNFARVFGSVPWHSTMADLSDGENLPRLVLRDCFTTELRQDVRAEKRRMLLTPHGLRWGLFNNKICPRT